LSLHVKGVVPRLLCLGAVMIVRQNGAENNDLGRRGQDLLIHKLLLMTKLLKTAQEVMIHVTKVRSTLNGEGRSQDIHERSVAGVHNRVNSKHTVQHHRTPLCHQNFMAWSQHHHGNHKDHPTIDVISVEFKQLALPENRSWSQYFTQYHQ
jgi:hypothetical protein